MNLQYCPRTETMMSAPPTWIIRAWWRSSMTFPFDRFATMRHWNDRNFDLFSASALDRWRSMIAPAALSKFRSVAAHVSPAQN
jgi:hypothetical protein